MKKYFHSIHQFNDRIDEICLASFKNFLKENNSTLIDTLSEHFNIYDYADTLKKEDVILIFKTVNQYLFDNKLKSIDIVIDDIQKISKKIFLNQKQNIKFVAVYHCTILNDEKINQLDDEQQLEIGDETIFINNDILSKIHIITFVDYLTHEMIHYYDANFGELKRSYYYFLKNNIKYDSHNITTFKIKMNQANRQGLNITKIAYLEEKEKLKNDIIITRKNGKIYLNIFN